MTKALTLANDRSIKDGLANKRANDKEIKHLMNRNKTEHRTPRESIPYIEPMPEIQNASVGIVYIYAHINIPGPPLLKN